MDFSSVTKENYGEILKYIKSFSDEKYKKFHSSIVNNSSLEIIGIRSPILKSIAKEILKGDYEGYLENSGKDYYEEVMIRGLICAQVKTASFEETKKYTESILPYIDNWAVCDGYCSAFKRIKKFLPEYFDYIGELIKSDNSWCRRVSLVLMLNYYLTDEYIDVVLERCIRVESSEYYVQMAQAWLLSAAYPGYSERVEEILKGGKLGAAVKRMTIQKCIDSFRVSSDDKDRLRELRRELKELK